MTISLNSQSFKMMPENVALPTYKAQQITAGILHIGVGNFHRAHQAMYLDRLFNIGHDHDWGLIGAGVKSFDAATRDKLKQQDWLTTVVELDEHGLTARVCGSMIDFVDIDPKAIIQALLDPAIRIVSLTITEGGYFIDAKSGGFQLHHPEIQGDINHPANPKTVFGVLLAALQLRHEQQLAPFTIMSCDNVPHNGDMTKCALLGLAKASNPVLANWIEKEVGFPNSMVDCITPATGEREKNRLRETFGIADQAPVFCEPFRQWVIEDNFPQGRPALEKVGVEFVEDVAPFELMKLRILNGGHMALAFPAALMGITYVHEAMQNTDIQKFLEKLMTEDVFSSLTAIPGVNYAEYFAQVSQRFANPEIGDTIQRLCVDSSNRLPKFILPTLAANIQTGRSITGLVWVLVMWCRFCAYSDTPQSDLQLIDENAEWLKKQAKHATVDPLTFLQKEQIFGNLQNEPRLRECFSQIYASYGESSIEKCLKSYISGDLDAVTTKL